jgi:hypothetical protein
MSELVNALKAALLDASKIDALHANADKVLAYLDKVEAFSNRVVAIETKLSNAFKAAAG